MKILAIDPGTTQSAFLLYDISEQRPIIWAKDINEEVLKALDQFGSQGTHHLAIEMVASYGMPVGAETFQTVYWIGRFAERWPGEHRLVYRADVKLHLTNSRRSKDPHVRQALIDKFGPGKDIAIGKKATPGPLYGLSGDGWSALAVAVTAAETEA